MDTHEQPRRMSVYAFGHVYPALQSSAHFVSVGLTMEFLRSWLGYTVSKLSLWILQ